MKHSISVLAFLLYFAVPGFSQIGATARIGIGSYSMKELKDLNESVFQWNSGAGLNLKQMEDFPSHPYYSIEVFYDMERMRIGIGYQYLTTGSRLYYSDYSGHYSFDVVVSGNAIILPVSIPLWESYVDIGLFLQPQFILCNTNIKTIFFLEDVSNIGYVEEISAKALNLGTDLGMEIKKMLGPIEISLFGGYHFSLAKGALTTDYYGEKSQLDPAIKNNWSGYRFALGVGFFLRKSSK